MTTNNIKSTEVNEATEPAKKKAPIKAKAKTTAKSPTPKKDSTPKKPRQKKLTLKSLQAKEATINTFSTYVLNEEDNTVIKYYKIFDESKIQFLLTEAFEKMQYAEENQIDFFTEDSEFYSYLSYLTIKYFTHLGEELADSTLEDDIAAMSALLSTGLFKTILNDVFDGNEIQKVLQTMTDHIEVSAKVGKYQAEMLEKVSDKIESPTIKGKLENTASYRNVLN